MDQLRPLSDVENLDVHNMKITCIQAEDALSQGLEKLQHALAENVAKGHLGEYRSIPDTSTAIEKLEDLVSFINQVNHYALLLLFSTRQNSRLRSPVLCSAFNLTRRTIYATKHYGRCPESSRFREWHEV